MAGDWIKMRTDLDRDPAVIRLADHYGWHEHVIVGLLWKLWSWADGQLADGNAVGVTESFINRYTGVADFAQMLRSVGWLEVTADGISFPKWDRHMSKSAKSRALTNVRVKRSRNAPTVTKALPEKRREEKRREDISTNVEISRGGSFPASLDSPEFRSAWDRWLRHLAARGKPASGPAIEASLMSLARMPCAQAVATLTHSTASGWLTLHPAPPDDSGGNLTPLEAARKMNEELERDAI